MILEAVKVKIKVPEDSVCGEGSFFIDGTSLNPNMVDGKGREGIVTSLSNSQNSVITNQSLLRDLPSLN